jgi:uncharacterized protein (TIGR02453 family)
MTYFCSQRKFLQLSVYTLLLQEGGKPFKTVQFMHKASIQPATLDFLKELTSNNNRDWFTRHKNRYLAAQANMEAFADALLAEMQKHDHIETATGKQSLMRIYRDTRFSKNKTPYKTHLGGGFSRATKKLRGGYYFQIGPGTSLAAGGFFGPNPADLLRIRQDMDYNHADWQKLLKNKTIAGTFGDLKGEKLITAPQGFAKDHPAIAVLRHKQLYFEKTFSDEEILHPLFYKEMNRTFKNLRPFFDYMSEVLTTDANGVSLI